MAGAEFKGRRIPGRINKDYVYPRRGDIDYFLDQGFNTFRLPFLWERLQPNLGGDFRPHELSRIDKVVTYVTGKKARVILDPHNYGRRFASDGARYIIGSPQVPTKDFVSFWVKLAERYKNNANVIFGLMNEPVRQTGPEWRAIMDSVVGAIRANGARNLILVPGTAWDGAHSWVTKGNAAAFKTFVDPGKNFAFEVHQYFDGNSAGKTRAGCVSETIGVERLVAFTKWLRDNNFRGFMGEFGATPDPVCMAALDNMLADIGKNSDVWIGWTYWAAGAWWGKYPFSVHPPRGGGDKPQMKVLRKHINLP
jgi:endoglucanase